VKLYTEEGYSTEMVTHELGIGKNTLSIWTKRYREEGAAGLENRAPVPVSRRQIDPADQRRPDDAYGLDGVALFKPQETRSSARWTGGCPDGIYPLKLLPDSSVRL
jgi:transposase-like protein